MVNAVDLIVVRYNTYEKEDSPVIKAFCEEIKKELKEASNEDRPAVIGHDCKFDIKVFRPTEVYPPVDD